MKKMQRSDLKFLIVFITLIFSSFHSTLAQSSSFRLKTADSLFQAKRYTQSLEHYQEILKQKQYSPAMLLKMAYIQEGLINIGQAMYYLNLYFLVTNDKSVLEKMEALADKYSLEGYEASDADRLLTFYHDNFMNISFLMVAMLVFFLSLVFYTKIKLKRKPVFSGVMLFIFLAGFFVHLNFGERVTTGIITSNRTYIMDGPSPGSSLVQIIGDGHRVEVIGKNDIWLKIRWAGDIAYVRANSLLPIKFNN